MRKKIGVVFLIVALLCLVGLCACKKEFTVTFDGNGGEFVLSSGYEIQTVSSGDELKPPKYTRVGYEFNTWDKVINKIDSDTTVKALWRAKTYTIQLKVGEYGLPLESETLDVTFDAEVAGLVAPQTESITHSFAGWVIEGTEKTVYDGMIWKEDSSKIILVAQWVKSGYTITYEGLQGTYFANGIGNPGVYDAQTPAFTLNNPIKDGHVFEGWQGTDIEGLSKNVSIDPSATDGLKDRTYTAVFSQPEQVYTLNFKLWAIVRNEKVNAKVNGSMADFNKVVLRDEKIEDFASLTPTLSGHDKTVFKIKGYYYLDADEQKVYINENTVFSKAIFGDVETIQIYVDITPNFSPNVP